MHPDPHYRTDSSESTACHRKKPRKEKDRGGYYGLPYGSVLNRALIPHHSFFSCFFIANFSDCDSPFSLTNLTLDFLDKHWAKEIDFVICEHTWRNACWMLFLVIFFLLFNLGTGDTARLVACNRLATLRARELIAFQHSDMTTIERSLGLRMKYMTWTEQ